MLAVTRCVSVLRPFLRVPGWAVLGYVGVSSLGMAAVNMIVMLDVTPAVRDKTNLSCLLINVCQCLLGITASVVTVLTLFLQQRPAASTPNKRMKSCLIVLLMNLPYVASVTLILKTITDSVDYTMVTFPLVACLTSLLNPLLIVLLNPDARVIVRNLYCDVLLKVVGRSSGRTPGETNCRTIKSVRSSEVL